MPAQCRQWRPPGEETGAPARADALHRRAAGYDLRHPWQARRGSPLTPAAARKAPAVLGRAHDDRAGGGTRLAVRLLDHATASLARRITTARHSRRRLRCARSAPQTSWIGCIPKTILARTHAGPMARSVSVDDPTPVMAAACITEPGAKCPREHR
jgi:hypothetical protein